MSTPDTRLALPELLARPIVYFDTEATGGKPGDRLVEIAAIRHEGGREVARFAQLVDPGLPVPDRAVAIHGLRRDDLLGAPPADVVIREFLEFARGAALLAFHVRFDARLLAFEAARTGIPLPHQDCFDVRHLVKPVLGPARPRQTDLASLVAALGLRSSGFHRAMQDTEAAIEVCHELAARARTEDAPRLSRQSLDLDRPRLPDTPPELAALRPVAVPPILEIDYDGKAGGRAWRAVIPSMLFEARRRSLLRAYCLRSRTNKLYHLSRVRAVRSASPAKPR